MKKKDNRRTGTDIKSEIVCNRPRLRAWFVREKGTKQLAELACFKTKQAAQDFIAARDKIEQQHHDARTRLFKKFAKHMVQKVP